MKKVLFLVLFLAIFAVIGFANLEAGPTFAASATSTVQLTVDSEMSLSCTQSTTMSPNLGLAQDSSVGTSTCTVNTTNAAGYRLDLNATTSPALVSGSNSFADYSTTTLGAWSVATNAYKFGFSVFGPHVNTTIWGTGNGCGTAGTETFSNPTHNYVGFYTAATTTAQYGAATSGTATTTICFAAEQGDSANAPNGTYQASIVATASAL